MAFTTSLTGSAWCVLNRSDTKARVIHQSNVGRCLHLQFAHLGTRLSPVHDVLLSPHPAICTPYISHRFATLTEIVGIFLHDPPGEDADFRVLWASRVLGSGDTDYQGRFQAFHVHGDLQ